MTTPADLNHKSVTVLRVPGLTNRVGSPAVCEGLLFPKVRIDSCVWDKPGFEGLMYHEAMHAYEYHALIGILILLTGAVGATVAFALGLWVGMLAMPMGVGFWLLWRRYQERRADGMAVLAAGIGEWDSMLRLGRPALDTAFERWCYGRTVEHRRANAIRMAERLRPKR